MLRHALGILQEQPGNDMGTSAEYGGNILRILWVLQEQHGNDMGTSEKHRGSTIYDNILWNNVAMLWQYYMLCTLGIPWEYYGNAA